MTPDAQPPAEAAERAAELRGVLAHHNHRYYVFDDPEVSDLAYDELLDELRALEARHPDLRTPDSPTQRVGAAPLESFAQVTHAERMLSLGNARNEEELRAWEVRVRNHLAREGIEDAELSFVTEPKIDGLAISLTYDHGCFSVGATRGDGQVGEDVTQNLRTIKAIPLRLDEGPEVVEARGEVYLPRSDFAKLNERRTAAGEAAFANPRNSAAGSIRQLDPQLAAQRPLTIWIYGTGHTRGIEFSTHTEELEWLRAHRFRVNPDIARHATIDEVVERCRWWEQRRDGLDYEIDGVVVKVDERDLWWRLGVAGREPRWSIAWKFPPTTATTVLRRVVWNVGRTGHLVPFAELEPVQVGGVTVSQATLHNEEDLERKDVREGDEVIVMRAGDVIPRVEGPVTRDRPQDRPVPRPPEYCPACGTATTKPEGVWTICPNAAGCPAQGFQHVKHFVSRGAMDIEGLGEKLARRLLDEKLIADVGDIFALTAEQLTGLEGFAELSAANLIEAIERSRGRPFGRLLYGLGIPGVGSVNADALAQHFGSMDALLAATPEQIEQAEGIGPVLAAQLVDELRTDRMDVLLDKLRVAGLRLALDPSEQRREEGPLAGKVVVLTGTLPTLSRTEAQKLARAHGAKVTQSVSGKTDYVVAGDNAGSKLEKAERLGVTVIDEQGLRELILTDEA